MTEANLAKSGPIDRATAGPFDRAEISEASLYIDFGSLLLPSREGLQVRLDLEEGTDRIVAISIDYQNSTLQLQAFAAPKSEGLWHSVREQLAQSLTASGSVAEERLGALGLELVSRMALNDENANSTVQRVARFIGVDGPRWFLRGVIGGAAINDPAAAVSIESIFRSVVVNRGDQPVPPRDLLPITLPPGVVIPPRPSN